MNDSQKWLEAAAGIEEDIQYLKGSLSEHDLASLQIALGVYLTNARTGVAWPRPDDLYWIETFASHSHVLVSTGICPDYKIAY